MATKVICRAYGSGSFFGLEFVETEVDGLLVGVAHTDDPELLAKFDKHPAFEVMRPEPVAPAVGTAEHYAALHAPQVLEALEAGAYSPEQALAFELLRDKPRSTVMAVLQPADDKQPADDPPPPVDGDQKPDGDQDPDKQADPETTVTPEGE